MIRARFYVARPGDPHPKPLHTKHPYWCVGYTNDRLHPIISAYADDEAEIKANWPEAYDIESTVETEYRFNDRFPKPDWFNEPVNTTGVELPVRKQPISVFNQVRARMLVGPDSMVGRRATPEHAQVISDASKLVLDRNPQTTSIILIALLEKAGVCIGDDGKLVKYNNVPNNTGFTPEVALTRQIIYYVERML